MFVKRLVSSVLLVAFSPLALGVGGCGGGVGNNAAGQLVKTPELPTDKQSKCKVAKSQSEPLIVEWPDAARGRLESVSRKGLVAVRYEGCELAVLSRCTVKSTSGGYGYSPITRKQSKITIKDADELYASMPVGAVKLESKLALAGQLNVQMTIVGRYESANQSVYREDLEGECSEATHVIAALTVGSFMFSAGSDAEVGGGATVPVVGVGGGGKSSASRETIQHDGDEASCTRATTTDKAPPEGCGALLQIEVMPLAKGVKVVAPVIVPAPVPASLPPAAPVPDPVIAEKPTGKPPRCKKGERIENGVCVKPGTKVAAVKPGTKPTIASAATACATGQHAFNGRCVDDPMPPSEPAPVPIEPPPPPPPVTSCLPGAHLENGACVVDHGRSAQYPSAYDNSGYGTAGNGTADQDRPNPWRTLLVYLAVGGGISATSFGIAALSAASKATDGCSAATKTCTEDAASSRDRAKTLAVITDVSLGVTALALVGFFILPSKVKVGAAPVPRGVAGSASWQF